jgi:CHASE2 domain-containing sensor protein
MHLFVVVSTHVRQVVGHSFAWIAKRWRNVFYVYLAAVFSVFIAIDTALLHVTVNMRQAAFDMMVRHRIRVPQPDKDIVIVDIDEASLASMAKEYGRWPWPRQVLGEFLEHLEAQRPRAVVFDILFSDPDVYNPDSDRYFDATVSETANTFFPMLRLDPASDALSQITPAMIPGVTPAPGQTQQHATIAVVLPHFPSILRGGRLGFHNIYPDPDGVVREYLVDRFDYGWAIPSLPTRVVRELGYRTPASPRVLLNWRGKPFSYPTISFSDVFDDMLSKDKRRPQDEFTNKLVLIGSTAPSLFDVKPTPMSRLHPGVEILATAIDNLKQGDYLRYPEGRFLYPLLALLIVWATAWAFYRNAGRGKIDRLFGASQFILLGVSFASINLTNTYINLTGPVTVALAYFTVARIYAAATSGALETSVVRASMERSGELHATLLLIRLEDNDSAPGDRARETIRRRLEQVGTEPKSVDLLTGRQKGIWALFEHTLAVSWVIPAHDGATRDRVTRDIANVTASLAGILPRPVGSADPKASWFVHDGLILGGTAARAGWRALFAEAQIRWHQATQHPGERTP